MRFLISRYDVVPLGGLYTCTFVYNFSSPYFIASWQREGNRDPGIWLVQCGPSPVTALKATITNILIPGCCGKCADLSVFFGHFNYFSFHHDMKSIKWARNTRQLISTTQQQNINDWGIEIRRLGPINILIFVKATTTISLLPTKAPNVDNYLN